MQSPKDIAINVKELVETVHYNLPECEIYVVSPLPCLPMHDYKHTPGVLRSNDLLKMIYKEFKKTIPYEYVTFINAYPTLCNKKENRLKHTLKMVSISIMMDMYAIQIV